MHISATPAFPEVTINQVICTAENVGGAEFRDHLNHLRGSMYSAVTPPASTPGAENFSRALTALPSTLALEYDGMAAPLEKRQCPLYALNAIKV